VIGQGGEKGKKSYRKDKKSPFPGKKADSFGKAVGMRSIKRKSFPKKGEKEEKYGEGKNKQLCSAGFRVSDPLDTQT